MKTKIKVYEYHTGRMVTATKVGGRKRRIEIVFKNGDRWTASWDAEKKRYETDEV